MPAFEPKSRRRLCAGFMDVDIEFLSNLVARANKVLPIGGGRILTMTGMTGFWSASMGEWLLSRRDKLIVARHEVPWPEGLCLKGAGGLSPGLFSK